MPLNALSDNLRIALCEKSSFFIGKFDVAKVYLWSSIVRRERAEHETRIEKEKKKICLEPMSTLMCTMDGDFLVYHHPSSYFDSVQKRLEAV
jgi:hypothetical protein